MTVHFWIGQDFQTTHERVALIRLLRQMQQQLGDKPDTYHLLANYTVGGNQVDLTVLKRDAIIVIELKECVEPFHATENGEWISTVSGHVLDTGNNNPLQQVRKYRSNWMTFLSSNQLQIMTKAKAAHMDVTHVSAFVVISPSIHSRVQNDIPQSPWFRLIGLEQAVEAIYQQTTTKLNFSDKEMAKILEILGVQDGDEKLGGMLQKSTVYKASPGSVPPRPALMVGRESALLNVKRKIGLVPPSANGAGGVEPTSPITILHGWPGVGKTTLAAALAHDPQIAQIFDKVLWASLGENPDTVAQLSNWAAAVGLNSRVNQTVESLAAQLRAHLRDKQILLIVDDVFEPEHFIPFNIGGAQSHLLVTTRFRTVAQQLKSTANDVIKLDVLDLESALHLLMQLAPLPVEQHRDLCIELVGDLECLPLAIQVAGRLLQAEAEMGWGVEELLNELREGTRLLEEKAPADRADIESQTIPTVAVLLKKSTDRLDDDLRLRFAFLGAYEAKPATFDLEALKDSWLDLDPKPTVRKLVDRGLLEPVADERYWMHSLLVAHARSLLESMG